MLRVGVTGGIGCGKSRVVRRLASRGLPVLDLDGIARDLMAPGGAACAEVVAEFGPDVLTPEGAINRKALAAVVFRDPLARARLNALVHPRVRHEEARLASAWAGDPRAVLVTEAALLVEAGMHLRFDRLIVVSCSARQQVERLMARDGIDAVAAQARIDSQMPVAEKLSFAHAELHTSGTLEDTDRAADALADQLLSLVDSLAPRPPVLLARALGCLVYGPKDGPRGLDPMRLLRNIKTADGLELEALARELAPPAEGPWYRQGRPGHEAPGPESLMGPLVVWAAGRRRIDPTFLAGAAATLARLTHQDPSVIGSACLRALLFDEVARGATAEDLERALPAWRGDLSRWGSPPTLLQVGPVLAAFREHPRDAPAAREACRLAGGDTDFAGALVGLASGSNRVSANAELLALLEPLTA